MKYKLFYLTAIVASCLLISCTQNQKQPANRVPAVSIDELINKMTLDEK